jgi:hypothetical protein
MNGMRIIVLCYEYQSVLISSLSGKVKDFLKEKPSVRRELVVLDIMSGLEYLHSAHTSHRRVSFRCNLFIRSEACGSSW